MRQRLQTSTTTSAQARAIAALAAVAAGLLLQGCATNYYACRQQGQGIQACDDLAHGKLG